MRIFIGIEIPEKIKKKISNEIKNLKNSYANFRWVKEENYHLTLLFLGEVKENKLEKIKKRLKRAIFDQESFFLFSYKFDLFINHQIVIYINFKRQKLLEQLAEKIRREFREYTYKTNVKKFVPHLTIARAKIPSKQQYFVLKKFLNKTKTNFYFKVEKITLYQSILKKTGPLYKKLLQIDLLQKED